MGTLTPGNGLQTPATGRHAATLTPNRWIPSPAVRRWLYGCVASVGLLLIGYGAITQDQLALWLQLLASVLLFGTPVLAAVNTPK